VNYGALRIEQPLSHRFSAENSTKEPSDTTQAIINPRTIQILRINSYHQQAVRQTPAAQSVDQVDATWSWRSPASGKYTYHAMNTTGEVRVKPRFLGLDTRWSWAFSSTPWPFHPQKERPVHNEQVADLKLVKKISVPAGTRVEIPRLYHHAAPSLYSVRYLTPGSQSTPVTRLFLMEQCTATVPAHWHA